MTPRRGGRSRRTRRRGSSAGTDVAATHAETVKDLEAAYDRWWDSVQPLLVNENAVGPKVNPFKELYWKQFGGGPDAKP